MNVSTRRITDLGIIVLSLYALLTVVIISIPRILYPYEIEWMEGSSVQQILRMVSGKPLFAAPSIDFVAWPYQPLFYYISAFICKIVGVSFLIPRHISIASSIGTSIVLFWAVKRITSKALYGVAAAGLYLAAYIKTGVCFDTARPDALSVLLLTSAFAVAVQRDLRYRTIASVSLFVLSYFAKQASVFFIPGFVLMFWLTDGWKSALKCLLLTLGSIFLCSLALDLYYNGWEYYYTIVIPSARRKTLHWVFAIEGMLVYPILRCWLPTTIACIVSVTAIIRAKHSQIERSIIGGSLFFISSILSGFLGLLNEGGAHNDLLPIAGACALFFVPFVYDLSKQRRWETLAHSLLPLQLLLLVSFPFKDKNVVIDANDAPKTKLLIDSLRTIPGDIWLTYHFFIPPIEGKPGHAELLAVHDALLVDDTVSHVFRQQLDSAFTAGKWTYIIDDYADTFPHYRLSRIIPNPERVRPVRSSVLYFFEPIR